MSRCVRHSKKLPQASPDQAVGDPTRAQRPVRVEDGKDPGPLRGALRSEQTSSLLRREALPAVGRGARLAWLQARQATACRLGVRAEGYGQRTPGLRTPR